MIGDNKEVFFDIYCPNCKHTESNASNPESPCWNCLEQPVNVDSHKPICFEQKDQKVK